ncbi:MAG: nitrous oxide reductase accessory protein NosL [Acidimicrobiia bacterium]
MRRRLRWGRRRPSAGVFVAAALIAGVVLLGACGGGSSSGPPDIHYGRDVCDECHMIISDARFAAAYRLPDGTARKFDDIGDMVSYARRTKELARAERFWVHDYDKRKWIDAERAWYVAGEKASTPMASGLRAYATRARAEREAEQRGVTVLDWAGLLRQPGGSTSTTGAMPGMTPGS